MIGKETLKPSQGRGPIGPFAKPICAKPSCFVGTATHSSLWSYPTDDTIANLEEKEC